MGKTATSDQVKDFLKRFKAKVDEQGSLPVVNRRVNLSALAMFGIAASEVKSVVLALTEIEYRKGPEPDDDKSPGEIWEFETDYLRWNVYIKLKLDDQVAKCLSFHPSGVYR